MIINLSKRPNKTKQITAKREAGTNSFKINNFALVKRDDLKIKTILKIKTKNIKRAVMKITFCAT